MIPLVDTNSYFLTVDTKEYQLPTGFMYYFWGNLLHSSVNKEKEDRIHLNFSSYRGLVQSEVWYK